MVPGADRRRSQAMESADCRCSRRTPGRRRRTRRRTRRSSATRRPRRRPPCRSSFPDYNKGLSDFHAEHNWILNAVWEVPGTTLRASRARSSTMAVAGIVRMRSGNPLTPMLQTNRSRSLWSPSLGPGTGPDRPSYAPGRGPENAVTGNPDALVRSRGVRAASRPARSATSDATSSSVRICGQSTLPSAATSRFGELGSRGAARFAARSLQSVQSRELRSAVAHCVRRHG